MPRSSLPTGSHLPGEEDEEPWERPAVFSESVRLGQGSCGAEDAQPRHPAREVSRSPGAHAWWGGGDATDASRALATQSA